MKVYAIQDPYENGTPDAIVSEDKYEEAIKYIWKLCCNKYQIEKRYSFEEWEETEIYLDWITEYEVNHELYE